MYHAPRKFSVSVGLLIAGERGLKIFEYFLERRIPISFIFCLVPDPHETPSHELILALARDQGITTYNSDAVEPRNYAKILSHHKPDIIFIAGWRFLIPKETFAIPKKGMFVLHDSLLPRYRGFAPFNWAMINGEEKTGATLFKIAEEVDSGDIVDQASIPITDQDDAGTLSKKITALYLLLIERNFKKVVEGKAHLRKQNHRLATYTCKRIPEDGHIDWSKPSRDIFNFIRALTHPYPGAFSLVDGRKLYIWQAKILQNEKRYVGRIPGRIVEIRKDGLGILTGDGALLLTRVQWEGEGEQDAQLVLRSIRLTLR